MRNKIEKFMLGLLLAPLAPLAGFMAGWFIAYSFIPEKWMPYATLVGLLVGILVDFLTLKRLLDRAHELSPFFWLVVLLFYAVGMFGLFMGVPIFHPALAIPAGFVAGGRLAHEAAGKEKVSRTGKQVCMLTTGLLFLICSASAFFAMSSSSTPHDLEGMLRLPFSITPAMIWGVILVGGAGLLAVNWALTIISIRLTHRFLSAA